MADHVLEELAQGDSLVPELLVADHKVVEVVPVAGLKGSSWLIDNSENVESGDGQFE